MARDQLLHRGRTAPGPSPIDLRVPEMSLQEPVESFCHRLELLAGKTAMITGRGALASQAPLLDECGIRVLAGVQPAHRDACATAWTSVRDLPPPSEQKFRTVRE